MLCCRFVHFSYLVCQYFNFSLAGNYAPEKAGRFWCFVATSRALPSLSVACTHLFNALFLTSADVYKTISTNENELYVISDLWTRAKRVYVEKGSFEKTVF